MAVEIFTSLDQQTDINGIPLSGAKVYVYDVGTTTLREIFSDTALTVDAANPIICNADGRHDMRYTATGPYKVVVKNSSDVTQYTRDNIDGRIPSDEGPLAIENGGTGGTTAEEAAANLGFATADEVAGMATQLATLAGALGSVDATQIAVGTTAQRPETPAVGMIRRNTTLGQYEAYASGWKQWFTSEDVPTEAEALAGTGSDLILTVQRGAQMNPMISRKLFVNDEKAAGANGGTFTHGDWRTRDLDDVMINQIDDASVGSNQITLPAGTYQIWASAPAHKVGYHKARLRNTTANNTLLVGTAERAGADVDITTRSVISGVFTLNNEADLEIQHQGTSEQIDNGFGAPSAGFSEIEVYTIVQIWQLST